MRKLKKLKINYRLSKKDDDDKVLYYDIYEGDYLVTGMVSRLCPDEWHNLAKVKKIIKRYYAGKGEKCRNFYCH